MSLEPSRSHARRRAISIRAASLAAASAIVLPLGQAGPAYAQQTAAECSVDNPQFIDGSGYAITGQGFNKTWRLATGAGVTVAVVDSGIDTRNPHLRGAVVDSYAVPGIPGEFAGQGPDVAGHGTAVASIIAARPLVPESSLVGAAYQADLLSVRAYVQEDPDGTTGVGPTAARIAQGITWAVRNGADVINVSMSAPASDPDVDKIVAATELARSRDVVVVASAGDGPGGTEPEDVVRALRYPAAAPGVIGVSALNEFRYVDAWTIQGEHVDVAADGSDVLVAFFGSGDCLAAPENTYTSWSAAFVSGLAAQLRQRFPDETAEQIGYRILASATRPRESERWSDGFGWGIISPYTALTMTLDPSRAGPPFPGGTQAGAARAPAERDALRPLTAVRDPLASTRERLVWWSIGAGGALALLLLVRPLLRQRRDA